MKILKLNLHVWMKGIDLSIYEISVFFGFRLFLFSSTSSSKSIWEVRLLRNATYFHVMHLEQKQVCETRPDLLHIVLQVNQCKT